MRTSSHHTRLGVRALERILHDAREQYGKLGWGGKALIFFIIIAHVLIAGIIVTLGPKQIFQTLLGLIPLVMKFD